MRALAAGVWTAGDTASLKTTDREGAMKGAKASVLPPGGF
jgi:hypothetical protein